MNDMNLTNFMNNSKENCNPLTFNTNRTSALKPNKLHKIGGTTYSTVSKNSTTNLETRL